MYLAVSSGNLLERLTADRETGPVQPVSVVTGGIGQCPPPTESNETAVEAPRSPQLLGGFRAEGKPGSYLGKGWLWGLLQSCHPHCAGELLLTK